MGFLVIIPFATVFGWSIFAIFRWLRRGGYEQKWWRAFAILGSAGIVLGLYFAFILQYTVANVHLEGFPIPSGISNREKLGAPWTRSDMPIAIRAGAFVTDVLAGTAFCLWPIAIAAFMRENRGKLAEPLSSLRPPQ